MIGGGIGTPVGSGSNAGVEIGAALRMTTGTVGSGRAVAGRGGTVGIGTAFGRPVAPTFHGTSKNRGRRNGRPLLFSRGGSDGHHAGTVKYEPSPRPALPRVSRTCAGRRALHLR